MAGGNARRLAGTDAALIMRWFQEISANMNAEAQKRALPASRKADSSVLADVGDDEESLVAAEATPV